MLVPEKLDFGSMQLNFFVQRYQNYLLCKLKYELGLGMRFFLALYILFSPFTTWFSVTGWLRLPVIFILVCFVWFLIEYAFRPKPEIFNNFLGDYDLMVCLLFITFSFLYNDFSQKSLNHTLSFYFSFGMYYLLFKSILRYHKIGLSFVSKWAFLSLFLCSSILLVEFVLLNFFNLPIRKTFVFSEDTSNMYAYSYTFFKSVAGVCEEPSLMAFNMNALLGLSLFYVAMVQRLRKIFWPIFAVFVVALLCTSSAGGILFLVFSVSLVNISKSDLPRYFVFLILSLFSVYLLYQSVNAVEVMVDKIAKKMYLEDPSARIRVFTWEIAIDHWLESPLLGNGPGFGNQNGFKMFNHFFGYQNTYLKLLSETGIFALVFFVLFLIRKFTQSFSIQDLRLRKYLLISMVACVIHWFIADCYYHPSFWISLASVGLITENDKEWSFATS